MYQKFNPKDWLPTDSRSDIELVVSRIESTHTDITGSYADWRNLGFALSDELAESGRDFFQRISRFYPNYSHDDCSRQYDQCLRSQGHGIGIKTLFYLAKMAGIEIGGGESEKMRKGESETGDGSTENGKGSTKAPVFRLRIPSSCLRIPFSPSFPPCPNRSMKPFPDF